MRDSTLLVTKKNHELLLSQLNALPVSFVFSDSLELMAVNSGPRGCRGCHPLSSHQGQPGLLWPPGLGTGTCGGVCALKTSPAPAQDLAPGQGTCSLEGGSQRISQGPRWQGARPPCGMVVELGPPEPNVPSGRAGHQLLLSAAWYFRG